MTTTDTTGPDLTGAVAYEAVGDLARGTGTWWVRGDEVFYQRPDGAWTPPSILTAEHIRASPGWRQVDAATA